MDFLTPTIKVESLIEELMAIQQELSAIQHSLKEEALSDKDFSKLYANEFGLLVKKSGAYEDALSEIAKLKQVDPFAANRYEKQIQHLQETGVIDIWTE